MAQDCLNDCDDCDGDLPLIARKCSNWTLAVRVAYFHPFSKGLTQVYSRGWIDYEVEATRRLGNNFQAWIGTDWTHKRGELGKKPAGYHNPSRIAISPVHVGLKGVFPLRGNLDFYAGLGLCISFIKIQSHSDFYRAHLGPPTCKRFVHKNTVGAIVKTGVRYAYGKYTYFDFFADYYYSPEIKLSEKEFSHRKISTSGLKLGAGIGIFF